VRHVTVRLPSAATFALLAATVTVAASLSPAAAPAAPGEPVPTDRDCLRYVHGIDLETVTIPQLQAAMVAGRLTSVELVTAYLARIKAYSQYNAIRAINPNALAEAAQADRKRAAGRSRGPLEGIPVLLKDNVGTDDMPTTAGSIALAGAVPVHDATITAGLRAAGGIILGKTNLSEFANWMATGMPNGYSSLGGQVVNAYDGGDPSGSSSGSGVASSLALAAATIGTETSGSILSPALANSDVGLKTTRGFVSRYGIIPLAESFDVAGPIVRNVTDAAVIMSAIAGFDPNDPATADADSHLPAGTDFTAGLRPDALRGVRLAYSANDASGLSGASATLWQQTLQKLKALGATLVPATGLDNDFDATALELPAIFSEFHSDLNRYLQTEERPGFPVRSLADVIAISALHPQQAKYGEDRLIESEAAPFYTPIGEAQAQLAIDRAQSEINSTLDAANAVAFVAPDGNHIGVGAAAGFPQIVVPIGYPGGSRMGAALLGRAYSDAQILAVAGALQDATRARVPPTQVDGGASPLSCAAASQPPFTTNARAAQPSARRAYATHRKTRSSHPARRRTVGHRRRRAAGSSHQK
jgi:amidase